MISKNLIEQYPEILNPEVSHRAVIEFTVLDGVPNGDPDNMGRPRVASDGMTFLVTDVATKRKIRDYAADIEGMTLYMDRNIQQKMGPHPSGKFWMLKEWATKNGALTAELAVEKFYDVRMFGAVFSAAVVDENGVAIKPEDATKDAVKAAKDAAKTKALAEGKTAKEAKALADEAGKKAKEDAKVAQAAAKVAQAEAGEEGEGGDEEGDEEGRDRKTQILGPVQIGLGRSVGETEPPERLGITRGSTELATKERTMGEKTLVQRARFVQRVRYSGYQGKDHKVSRHDMLVFWTSLANGFEHRSSSMKGEQFATKLTIHTFKDAIGADLDKTTVIEIPYI